MNNAGHRKRLRDRFRSVGEAGFHDHELLELLLSYAIPRRDTKPMAKDLLNNFGTLNGVIEADPDQLVRNAGLGESTATLLKLVHVLCLKGLDPISSRLDYLKSPDAVADYFRKLLRGCREERFVVAFLNTKNRIDSHLELQQGTVDQAVVYPRRVVEAALSRKARSVILVHNHPSGDPTPSSDDQKITVEIEAGLSTVGIMLLDHVIVGSEAHFSFRDAGLL